eukprot:765816-Hanusia_phi.AAC.1
MEEESRSPAKFSSHPALDNFLLQKAITCKKIPRRSQTWYRLRFLSRLTTFPVTPPTRMRSEAGRPFLLVEKDLAELVPSLVVALHHRHQTGACHISTNLVLKDVLE